MKLFSPFSKSILAFTAAAMLFTGCKDDEGTTTTTPPVPEDPDPTEEVATITSIDPTSGPVGTEVTISGTNFGEEEDGLAVDFNGTEAEITSVSDDAIVVVVPAEATTGNVNLTIDGETIEGPEFTVTAAEAAYTVTGLDPTEGPVGTEVTISGTNFGEEMEGVTVSFNGTDAVITSITDEAIVVTVPDDATTGRVSVAIGDEGLVEGPTFTVIQVATEPGIASIDPTSGVPGMTVRINGLGFGDEAEDVTVNFNGTEAEVTRVTDTQVEVIVPEEATTGTVSLSVGEETYEGPEFTVLEGLEEEISFGDGFPLEGMATLPQAFIYKNGGLDGNNALRLVPNKADRTGAAYYASKIPVSKGFETTFAFRVSRPGKPEGVEGETGADGFSFIIQNQGLSAIGSRGADMGYGGINDAVVVEFDIYENAEDGDVSGNHISVQSSVNGRAVQADENYRRATTTYAEHPDLPEFIGNETEYHIARIVYEPGTLRVWVDDMENPLVANITLEDYMNMEDGRAYVGFTASTSPTYGWASFDILNWTLSTSNGTGSEGEGTDTEE